MNGVLRSLVLLLLSTPGSRAAALIDHSSLVSRLGFAGVRLTQGAPQVTPVAEAEEEADVARVPPHYLRSKQYLRAASAVGRQRATFRAISRTTAGASGVFVSGWVPNLKIAFADEPPTPDIFDLQMVIAQTLAQASAFFSDAFHIPL